MNNYLKRSWAQIDLGALHANVLAVRRQLRPGCKLMCVVKAYAYGHGDRFCAQEMALAGADWFGVSNIDEALSLRGAGITQPILVFGTTPPEMAGVLAGHGITQAVFCAEYAAQLAACAGRQGVRVRAHIKIDTGMGRIGFDGFEPLRCAGQVAEAAASPALICEGIFTHFSCADEDTAAAAAYTRAQYERFQAVLGALKERGITFALRHCCNSAGTLCYPGMHLDMVRPGLILYGLYPSARCTEKVELAPVMQVKSVVSQIKEVPAGREISYGRAYKTKGPQRLATVPIGYADGYPRALSNKGAMLLRGQRAPVAGRVCMDQLLLDATGIVGASMGDEVTVFGAQEGALLPVEEMAGAAGTFNYEVVCLIGRRVPRLYVKHGRECGVEQGTAGIPNLDAHELTGAPGR